MSDTVQEALIRYRERLFSTVRGSGWPGLNNLLSLQRALSPGHPLPNGTEWRPLDQKPPLVCRDSQPIERPSQFADSATYDELKCVGHHSGRAEGRPNKSWLEKRIDRYPLPSTISRVDIVAIFEPENQVGKGPQSRRLPTADACDVSHLAGAGRSGSARVRNHARS